MSSEIPKLKSEIPIYPPLKINELQRNKSIKSEKIKFRMKKSRLNFASENIKNIYV